ncbi:FecR/PupR family sigma factor regulator, partial [Amaricoccus sp.]|uniref:FecR/PupR family sigma factor regulator n=1 Tax=Amaricoccus sp. TaxID=1872485 RepID=UPI002C9B73C7
MDREAAAWVVRLGSPALDDADRLAFREWLDSDPAHPDAFAAAGGPWHALEAAAAGVAAAGRGGR